MGTGGVLTVAKKRKEAPKAGKAKAQPGPASVVISFRVSPEYRAWLDGLATHERINLSDIFDRAMVDYARKVGYPAVAPPRS